MGNNSSLSVVSLFSGCGGLDLGFEQAGYDVRYANDIDPAVKETYELNHAGIRLDGRSIADVSPQELPEAQGFIGGPPCQSWSLAGAMRGADDPRGRLFFEYIRLLEARRPLFFLAENVKGLLSTAHKQAFASILSTFKHAGYVVDWKLVNASAYGVPQDRERVIIVGYRDDLGKRFRFPRGSPEQEDTSLPWVAAANNVPAPRLRTLCDAIGDLPLLAIPALKGNHTNGKACQVANHEYMTGDFSSRYMSRNRLRLWNQPSFTIQAGGRHAPLHPSSPPMHRVGPDEWVFEKGREGEYRRLSVRECARIQTFPDDFRFEYGPLSDGYKMIGNAVPVVLARVMAQSIAQDLLDMAPKKEEGGTNRRSTG